MDDAGQIFLLSRKVAVLLFWSYSAFSPGGRVALGCQLSLGRAERQIKFGTATTGKARSFNCKCLADASPRDGSQAIVSASARPTPARFRRPGPRMFDSPGI